MTQAPAAIDGTGHGQLAAARRLSKPGRPRFPMFRVVFQQHGVALAVLVVLSAIAVAAMVISEPRLRHVEATVGASSFLAFWSPHYPDLAMQAFPLLAALFVGVPLVSREIGTGAGTFAWTQGYSSTRWLLGKLAAAAAVLVPAAVALGLVFGWWYQVYVPAAGYFRMHAFALYAPALAGWMQAGLTLGMAAGAVTGRDGRGLLLTITGWVVLHATVTLGSAGTPAGDFWPLQAAQLAILAAISALFTGVTIWVLRGAPAPGMPLLRGALRQLPRVPWPRKQAPDLLALELTGARPRLALARVVWRQHRAGLSLAAGVLGVYAILLLVTGLHVHAEPASLRPRLATVTGLSEPGAARNGILLLPTLLPFVIGALVGAVLTRPEFDRRTAAFAWAQGITRIRWGTGTLITAGLMLVLPAIGAGLVFQWWNQPYTATRLADPAFALYAPVFAGWLLVNGAAASLAGALARSRTVAVFACLACTVPAAVANAFYLRPHYLPPVSAVNRPAPAGSLLLNWYVGKPGGQPLTGAAAQRAAAVAQRFGHGLADKNDWTRAARALGQLHAAVIQTYEPASRFWPYQAVEAAGLLTTAILLGAATIWIIHRRAV
jgi:hypothetical protein